MADMTNVDAGKLRQSALRIGNLAGELSGNVSKISEAINNLSKSWVSDAAVQFLQNWHTDEEALLEMADQYREVSEIMNELAQDFEASERESESLVSKVKI